jgi:hypothetical protein
VIILLVAFALRVVQLDRRPLWWDEGNSVYFAHQSLSALVSETRVTNDTDPPVYRLALGGWRMLAGSSPFALRFFSALLGVLVVALTWAVGCWLATGTGEWLAGRGTALLAALFVALSPMQVHYTREAKGYAFATVCALLSVYAWGRGLGYFSARLSSRSESIRWWTVYALSTAAAIGAHYYLGLLVLWQGLWVMGSAGVALIRGSPARHKELVRLGQWILAVGAVALLLTPWALTVFGTTVRGVTGLSREDALSPWNYLSQVGVEFGAGPNGEGIAALIASCGLAILAVVGALSGGKRAFLLTWVVVPLAAAYLVQAAYSFFFPRFLLYLGPVCYLLVGRGIESLGRPFDYAQGRSFGKFILNAPEGLRTLRLSAATVVTLVIVVIVLWVPGLTHVYAGPVDEAEDPRPAIARIRSVARPDDALVYVYIWQAGYLLSYYPQNELSFYRAYFTPQTVGPELERIFAEHPRLWLLSYRIAAEDAHNLSASWLEAEAYKRESNWYGRHHLALYLSPDFRTPGVGPDEGVACFDGRIELRYPLVSARLSPGDEIALPLRWRALTALDEDYVVFAHLGLPDAPPLAQSDGLPRNGLDPTSTWVTGQEVLDRRVLSLPDTFPPGRYPVMVGLYRLSDGSRLPVSGANDQENAVLLGYVWVED